MFFCAPLRNTADGSRREVAYRVAVVFLLSMAAVNAPAPATCAAHVLYFLAQHDGVPCREA
jgi:hypothetical protein